MPFDLMILYNFFLWKAATGAFGPVVQTVTVTYTGIVVIGVVVGASWLIGRRLKTGKSPSLTVKSTPSTVGS